MIRILLAEDHNIVRQALRRLLEDEPDMEVVGEARDGIEAVHIARQQQPDVLVVDVVMPGLNGLDVVRQVSQLAPGTTTIILSMHASEGYVAEALVNGARGYVLKDSSTDDLVKAIRKTVAGEHYLSPPLSQRSVEAYLQKAESLDHDPYETLTARERQVLHLVAEGLTNKEAADRLSLSPRTIETHRANLMDKLSLDNQADLVRYAVERGLVK